MPTTLNCTKIGVLVLKFGSWLGTPCANATTYFLASSLHQLHLFWVLLAHPSTYELLLYATWVGCHDVLCSWQLNTQLAGAWWAKCGQVGASVGISGGKLRQVCASRGQVGASGDQLGTSWDMLGLVGSVGDQELSSWAYYASQAMNNAYNSGPNLLGLVGTSWE